MTEWLRQHYLELKLVHLSAAGLWSASALGAFWFVIASWLDSRRNPADLEIRRRDTWVRQQFLIAVILEHIAFVVLLPSGFALMFALGFTTSMPWFAWKLGIVLVLFVPLEIIDIWLSHWHVPRALTRAEANPEAARRAVFMHDVFLWVGGALVCVTIPVVLYLVVMKPTW